MLKYLDDKANITFEENEITLLERVYLIRNIIAHYTGIVKLEYKSQIPSNILGEGDELMLDKTNLTALINFIVGIEQKIESFCNDKFFSQNTV